MLVQGARAARVWWMPPRQALRLAAEVLAQVLVLARAVPRSSWCRPCRVAAGEWGQVVWRWVEAVRAVAGQRGWAG